MDVGKTGFIDHHTLSRSLPPLLPHPCAHTGSFIYKSPLLHPQVSPCTHTTCFLPASTHTRPLFPFLQTCAHTPLTWDGRKFCLLQKVLPLRWARWGIKYRLPTGLKELTLVYPTDINSKRSRKLRKGRGDRVMRKTSLPRGNQRCTLPFTLHLAPGPGDPLTG